MHGEKLFYFSLKKIDFYDSDNIQCDDFNKFVIDENCRLPFLGTEYVNKYCNPAVHEIDRAFSIGYPHD